MKKIIFAAAAIVLVIALTACSMFASTTEKYMNALNKTVNAESMQVQTKYTINMDLSKAPENIKKDFESFKEITMNTDQWIDNKNQKSETRSFTKAGEIMLDSKIYAGNGKVYMKSTLLKDKYIDLTSQKEENPPAFDQKQFEKFYGDLVGIWKVTVQNEILATEGNSIENTPDGDIKVSIAILELNDEKVKNILSKIAELISKNESMITMVTGGTKQFNDDPASAEEIKKLLGDYLKKLPQELEKNKDKFAVENLKLTAKLDKDSYIIDETFEGTLVLKLDGELRINFSSHTTRWNINSGKVNVVIPEIKQEDILDMEELQKDGVSEKYSEEIKKMFEMFKKQ